MLICLIVSVFVCVYLCVYQVSNVLNLLVLVYYVNILTYCKSNVFSMACFLEFENIQVK